MKENTIPFWAQPTSKLEFHSTEEQKIKEETMEESLSLGKKLRHRNQYWNSILVSVADTETRFWSYTSFYIAQQIPIKIYGIYLQM